MSEIIQKLSNPPIVEAVLDIDCDMPPTLDWAALKESARNAYREYYPQFQTISSGTIQIEGPPGGSQAHKTLRGVQSLQFFHEDRKQLVQVRSQGYSFNRLAPYSALDDYLPEIERTWKLFVGIAGPKLIRTVRLSYINRIVLPVKDEKVLISQYFKVSPQLPDESDLIFTGFLNQHSAVEKSTGNQANILLTTLPNDTDNLPVILDIGVIHREDKEVENWDWIAEKIQSLRNLKNRIFKNTLTDVCLSLFQ
ncbi:MAG: TIGR04255 family protein [Phycisphaerales bacterium]|nr:TIGR04255 family protein [Phycisphaerales bacterium]